MSRERSRKQLSPLWWSCEARISLYYVPGKIDKVVFVTVQVLLSSYRPVYLPGKIEKAVFTSVQVL